MSRVSYQVGSEQGTVAGPQYAPLPGDAIGTRKRDATVRTSVDVSKRQARWLKTVTNDSAADTDAIMRALLDLAMELHLDWSAITRPTELRDAIRAAVLIRSHI
jgi:hypothetical protein